MKFRIFAMLLLCPLFCFAQNEEDSLLLKLEQTPDPLLQFDLLLSLLKTATTLTVEEPRFKGYLEKAKAIAESQDRDSLKKLYYYAAGTFYLNGDRDVLGLESLFTSLKLSEELKDSITMTRVNYRIGAHYYWKEDGDKALEYMETALNVFPQLSDRRSLLANYQMAVAVVLQDMNRNEESLAFHQKALATKRKEKAFKDIPISLSNMGGLQFNLGDTVKGLKLFEESIRLADSLGQTDAKVYAEYIIGLVQFHKSKNQLAATFIVPAVEWWEQQKANKDLQRAYPILAENYSKLNQHQKASQTLQKLIDLKSEYYNESKLESLQEMETKYQTEKKALENENLKETNSLIQARNNQYLIGAGVLAGLLGLLGVFFVQMRRAKEQLNVQNKTIEKQNQQLTELDRIKTNFFSNITHEFRTPLTLILEPLRQVLREDHDGEIKEKLNLAKNNSEKLLQLVNQLLDISKLEAGKMRMDLRKGEVVPCLEPIFKSFIPLCNKKEISLTWSADENIVPFYFDKDHLEKVFYNLLSNAIKFTEQGGVAVDVSYEGSAKTTQEKPFLKLQVKDTGIGIPKNRIAKIFERFYQVDNSSTRKSQGTGIGLALTKELVELMGGNIKVQSEMGKETTFVVKLPMQLTALDSNEIGQQKVRTPELVPATAIDNPPEKEIRLKDPTSTIQEQILIIEDNPELAHFIELSLQKSYHIVLASDGAAGIEKAKKMIPDLIISDLMMPKKDGFGVVEDLKNDVKTSHIPIILLTAKTAIESKLQGLRKGADDYLTKPFNTEELIARIENLIATRKKLQEKFSGSLVESILETDDSLLSKLDTEFLAQVKENLESNLDENGFSVEILAKALFMSRSQLFRKLKALTGQTPNIYIRHYRLDRAKEMLLNKEGNVSQIALRVGFEDSKYFSKRFKERFGRSPSEW